MKDFIDKIGKAFSERKFPEVICHPEKLSDDEYREATAFAVSHWLNLDTDILESYYEAIFWLTPEAFCYYLPGILKAGMEDGIPDLLINHALINMLDRSPVIEYWDDFFRERWLKLNKEELSVISEWILWLTSFEKTGYDDISLTRAFDTIELLMEAVG